MGFSLENWGDAPFTSLVGSWYWGHGQLGPYTIVWYSALTPSGSLSQSAYVSENGKILVTSCAKSSITVRPFGKNAVYPPVVGTKVPDGYNVAIRLDDGKELEIQAKISQTILGGGGVYFRFTGGLTGGIKGGKKLTGTALFEQFALIPPS